MGSVHPTWSRRRKRESELGGALADPSPTRPLPPPRWMGPEVAPSLCRRGHKVPVLRQGFTPPPHPTQSQEVQVGGWVIHRLTQVPALHLPCSALEVYLAFQKKNCFNFIWVHTKGEKWWGVLRREDFLPPKELVNSHLR